MKHFHETLPVCPWWLIHTFDNPLRRLFHDAEALASQYALEGKTVLDLGCGYGYFTAALARAVGPSGRVIAVDVQPRMLEGARKRLKRAHVEGRVDLRQTRVSSLDIVEPVDFALAFYMLHEVPDQRAFLTTLHAVLRPGGRVLVVEPILHVPRQAFEASIKLATDIGFGLETAVHVRLSHATGLRKSSGGNVPGDQSVAGG